MGKKHLTTGNAVQYTIERWRRYWAVRDPKGALVCLTVYRRGAEEVIRRLSA
jgi:hypothetical protein